MHVLAVIARLSAWNGWLGIAALLYAHAACNKYSADMVGQLGGICDVLYVRECASSAHAFLVSPYFLRSYAV